MMENGLLDEVKSVMHMKHLSTLKTVGYTELFNYIENKTTLIEAINIIKQNTRRYAKRQLTWFRKHTDAVWIDFSDSENMAEFIINQIKF